MHWLSWEPLCEPIFFFFFFFMYFCIKSSIGTRVKLAGYKSALKSPVVYSTDCSKAVVSVLFLLFVVLCSFVVPPCFLFLYVLWC